MVIIFVFAGSIMDPHQSFNETAELENSVLPSYVFKLKVIESLKIVPM